jgi:UDP-glucuronate 4-epimerase
VRYSIENPTAYVYSNVVGSLNVFELARQKNIKKVMYASSSSVYGLSKPPFSEINSSTDTPISPYAATKKSVEVLAHSYSHLFGITMVGLRFFTVYGNFYRPDMALFKFAKNILKGKEIILYNNGEPKRGYTHIDDCVDGIIKAMELKKGNYLINLGGSEDIKVKDMVKILEKYLGKKAKVKYGKMAAGDVFETKSDQTLSKKLLGFKPKKTFDQGVKEFCEWFLQNQDWLLKLKQGRQ